MSRKHITLTPFQETALHDTANISDAGLLVVPLVVPRTDVTFVRRELKARHAEVKQLVEMGLMEDVSKKHSELLKTLKTASERRFLIYGLTETGRLLFQESNCRSIN